jgi:hypothetical protein
MKTIRYVNKPLPNSMTEPEQGGDENNQTRKHVKGTVSRECLTPRAKS